MRTVLRTRKKKKEHMFCGVGVGVGRAAMCRHQSFRALCGRATNEYLAAFRDATDELRLLGCRPGAADLVPYQPFFNAVVLPLRRSYAWGIPSSEALQAIADVSPNGIVEIGAGTGYWAHLLEQQHDLSVLAFDSEPLQHEDINGFHALANLGNVLPFARVNEGGAEQAALHPDRTLFLCWPPRESDGSGTGLRDVAMMAADALEHYDGSTVAYVGVHAGSMDGDEPDAAARHDTAGPIFHAALASDFDLVRQVELPNWPPLRDSLTLWQRKGTIGPTNASAAESSSARADGTSSASSVDGAGSAGGAIDASGTERRAHARAAALADIRYANFDRQWARSTLAHWARRRWANEAAAASEDEAEMLRRSLARAPWAARTLGRLLARRLEPGF